MSALIGALRVSLSAETANFEAGMKRAQRTTNATSASINKSLNSIKSGLKGLAAAITVGFLAKGIENALEYAGSLAEVAQQLGVTAKQLQVYRFAAGQVGVSQEQLEVGLKKLNVTLGQAKLGAEGPKKAFAELSKIIGQDIVASSKQGGDALPKVADALAKVEDRSKRAAVEVALMGKSGSALDNLLSGGSAALNELSRAAEKLGIVLSDEEIKHADETADKLRAVKTVLSAQIASTVAKNADSILALANSLGTLTTEIIKFLNSNPQLALGIVGALLGGRVGGLPGAAVGAVGGAALGGKLAQNLADSNMDKAFRRKQFIDAEVRYQRGLRIGDTGKRVIPGVGVTFNDVSALKKERDRQEQLFRQSILASKRPKAPVVGSDADIGQFLAGEPKKAKEDHTAEQRLREQMQFAQDLRRAQIDVLQAKRELAHSSEEQAALDIQILDKQKEDYDQELQYEVALNKLTKGKDGLTEEQAKQLQIEYDKTDALKRQQVAENLAAQKAHDAAELKDNQYDLQIEQLQLEADLATNSKARRDAELRILAVMKEQERARLEAVIADKNSSDLAKKEAQARLGQLDQIYAGRQQVTMNQTADPLQQWMMAASDTTDAMQQLKVQGINGAIDSIIALSDGFKSFRDTALQAIKQVIAELIRMQLMKLAMNIIGGASGAPMGGGGSLLSGMSGSDPAGFFSGIGFATGGSMILGGRGGTDRNLLSLNGLPIAKVSRGETMHIVPDGKSMGGMSVVNHFTVAGNVTRETQAQIANRVRMSVADAQRRGY